MSSSTKEEWKRFDMSPSPFNLSFGGSSGMSGRVGGGAVHLHCGGRDMFDRKYTRDCFTFVVSEEGTVLLDAAQPLPSQRAYSCHGSDG